MILNRRKTEGSARKAPAAPSGAKNGLAAKMAVRTKAATLVRAAYLDWGRKKLKGLLFFPKTNIDAVLMEQQVGTSQPR